MKITKSKEWYWNAYLIVTALAWVFCIVPTLIAGVVKLPVIATKNAESTLSGSFTIVLICGIYPLYKGLVKLIKSPSAPVIMWFLFGITFLLYKISHETLGAMVTIFFVAAVGNTIGALLFFISSKFKEKAMFLNHMPLNENK